MFVFIRRVVGIVDVFEGGIPVVVQEDGSIGGGDFLNAAVLMVVSVRDKKGAVGRNRGQAFFSVVGEIDGAASEDAGAPRKEVAVGVVGEGRGVDGGVLIESVGRVFV